MSHKTLIATTRFFALQDKYFWGRGQQLCSLCNRAPATLSHLLCHCAGTSNVRDEFHIPDDERFLRVALLT